MTVTMVHVRLWAAGRSLPAWAQSLGARPEQHLLVPQLDIYERDALNIIIVV